MFGADGADFTLRLVPATRDWPSVLSELAAALAFTPKN